jgi:hypothetical protein
MLFYFGCRVIEEGRIKPVFKPSIFSLFWNGSDFFVQEEINLAQQYENRTQAHWESIKETDKVSKIFDGLHVS